ncbi:hypothetical protein KMZ68_13860 [Bradyrhizobium sediminis]|uniref:Uncharacterized protein n=1 Tax=Bradyrhizobium sediminis TaxID=2840469 RepID=A0A975NJS9_9BRAD|nr:hypothetical protein [Bradyrhizobium sediminis]QWG16130.1 hypothetical protein KMZ68_13860 [Bradyrhizobium sediminis]
MANLPKSLRPSDPDEFTPLGDQTDLLAELGRQLERFNASMAADAVTLRAMTLDEIGKVTAAKSADSARERRFEDFAKKHCPPTMGLEQFVQELRELRALAVEWKQYEELALNGPRITSAGEYFDDGDMAFLHQIVDRPLRSGTSRIVIDKATARLMRRRMKRMGRDNAAGALAEYIPRDSRPRKCSAQAVCDRMRIFAKTILKHPHRRRKTESLNEFHRILIDDFYDGPLIELKSDRPSVRMSKRSESRIAKYCDDLCAPTRSGEPSKWSARA